MKTAQLNPDIIDKWLVSFYLALKTLVRGKKWIIAFFLAIFPLFFTVFVEDKLFGSENAQQAYVDLFLYTQYYLFFTFSCLLLCLPISSDEIADHTFDLYIVRPVRREVLWASRWAAACVGIFVLNVMAASVYYFFFHIVDKDYGGILDNIDLLWSTAIFLSAATLTYAGIFLLVGFIGNRGFTLGVFLAIFELFLLSLLFLADEPYIPRTHMMVIADWLFDPRYIYEASNPPDLIFSWFYVGMMAFFSFIAGIIYLRIREIN